MEKKSLSLQSCKVQQPLATINKIHTILHSITILSLLYYRVSVLVFNGGLLITKLHKLSWVMIFGSELLVSFLWLLEQAYRWRPVSRTVYPERLPPDTELPAIDVFICTADPKKEPTVGVMNTVLSAMSLDYPPHKLSVYLSDDAGSPITHYAIKEAFVFAKSWIPFCKKYGVETRCPEAYFSASTRNDELHHGSSGVGVTMRDKEIIKAKYEVFKQRVEKTIQNADTNNNVSNKDHPALVEVITGSDGEKDVESDILEESESEVLPMPLLVYVAREKRPSHPHHFKAGALNVLFRVSSILSNSPYVLVLDCDMYCNDPSSARQAMCFHLDPNLNSNSSFAFIQFPQTFHNVSRNDIYNGQIRYIFQTAWYGIDGLKGPTVSGTGFYIKREALYGIITKQDIDLVHTKERFGDSNMFIALLNQNNCKFNGIANGDGDESNTLVKEARYLASCAYEKNTKWGEQVGFMYHCVVEDYFTGFLLHCKGWTSAYCGGRPSKPPFLGSAPTNLNDTLVQSTRWSSGLLQVGLSRFCPLIYGFSKMHILQNMAYAALAVQPLYALPTLCFAIIPQICLINGISLYPKASSPWFYVFLVIYVSSIYQNILEILLSGGSIRSWWYDYRMFIMKSVTSFPFALMDLLMKFLGLKDIEFLPTNKVVDEEQDERYKMDIIDFQTGTTFLLPFTTLSILNMASLFIGLRRVIIERCFDEMLGQIILSFIILMVSYPVIEAMFIRKDNGRIRTSVTVLTVSVLMIFFSFKALLV